MSKYLIIDGYNAINKIPALSQKRDKSLESSRHAFINILSDFLSRNGTFNKIYLVFDSKIEDLSLQKYSFNNIEILFGNAYKEADNLIVDILKRSDKASKIVVVSDDNFVKNHVRAFGASSMSIKELEDIIILKKSLSRSKISSKDYLDTNISKINEELKKHWRIS